MLTGLCLWVPQEEEGGGLHPRLLSQWLQTRFLTRGWLESAFSGEEEQERCEAAYREDERHSLGCVGSYVILVFIPLAFHRITE